VLKWSLSSWDYKALDRLLEEQKYKALLGQLDWSTPEAMDLSFYRLTVQIIRLMQEKARAQEEIIPANLVERQLSFIECELGIKDCA